MKVKYLKDQFNCSGRAILMCECCGGEYSAHLGDYSFQYSPEHDLTCCGESLILVEKRTIYQSVSVGD